MSGQHHSPTDIFPAEIFRDSHLIEDCVNSKAGLGGLEKRKINPLPGIEPEFFG
jgi:hypothetical protein